MEADAPWMEPLDIPIEMADFFGLDKDNSFEQLVEIRSPVQELENVENLPAFCMLEPEVHIDTPELREVEATPPEETPPEETPPEETPPEDQNVSPTPDFFLEPIVQITTPDVVVVPEKTRIVSPEIFLVEDYPEKLDNHSLSVEGQSTETFENTEPLFDESSDVKVKQELRIRLIRIDETLTIINNRVILPLHLCGSDSCRSSHASSSSSKSRGRRDRATINQRSPYSLRIKLEPIDDEDASSYPKKVRFNPYAPSAEKTTANKRSSVAKGKQTKGKQTQPMHSQADEGDDFLPTDFLEASMSEGVSSTKQQPWPGSLLEKTLKSGGKRQPVQIARNGTSMFVNVDAGGKAGTPLQRLSSFRGGIVKSEADGADSYDSVVKVMANTNVSLTTTAGKALTMVRKGPGQKGMVNHDHLYSNRLSNENVTRLEAQIKTLQAENRVMKVETETLRKQLKAANNYISTSLNAAVKPPPLLPYPARPQQARPQQARPQQARTQLRAQSRPVGLQALRVQAMLPQAIRAQPLRSQSYRPQYVRGPVRPQQIRGQMNRPRTSLPLTITQRSGNPGVMVAPTQSVRPLTASTRELTVIPIRRGTRPPDPDVVMPAFEQVNVNEHFGMHFLTE